jgi:methyl-accepting chemotaxis protein
MIAVAAMIAAVSFAVLVIAAIVALIRLTNALKGATQLVTAGQEILKRADAAVERANEQLDRTDAVTASMDELGSGMARLADQVQTVAGLGRALAASPAGKAAAFAYGVRQAVGKRRHPTVRGSVDRAGAGAGHQTGAGRELSR